MLASTCMLRTLYISNCLGPLAPAHRSPSRASGRRKAPTRTGPREREHVQSRMSLAPSVRSCFFSSHGTLPSTQTQTSSPKAPSKVHRCGEQVSDLFLHRPRSRILTLWGFRDFRVLVLYQHLYEGFLNSESRSSVARGASGYGFGGKAPGIVTWPGISPDIRALNMPSEMAQISVRQVFRSPAPRQQFPATPKSRLSVELRARSHGKRSSSLLLEPKTLNPISPKRSTINFEAFRWHCVYQHRRRDRQEDQGHLTRVNSLPPGPYRILNAPSELCWEVTANYDT